MAGCMKKLPLSTVRLIGSTQVITSPLSVVKELLENSLDADSTNIQIKLENFGFDKIEVRDNGSGIKTDDTEFMGQPHYTSKIKSHFDLEGLVTYGFRGEALGSLCAVSDVAITTKTADDVIGYTYSLDHKGQIKSKTPSHIGQGTTVIATGLFKDLPVRRQFYNTAKKKKDCLKNLEDLFVSFGVIHPEIRLTLHHNKESLWQKSIVPNYRMVLLNVLGSTCVNCMEYHDYHDDEVDIEVYLPRPTSNLQVTGKTSTDRTFIFVNKRPVVNKDIEKLLKKYFTAGTKSETSRYPVGFVSLTVAPTGLDVNLDPNKTRIMFHQKVEILEALENLLSDLYGRLEEKTKSKDSRNDDLENNNEKNKENEMKRDDFESSLDETDHGSRPLESEREPDHGSRPLESERETDHGSRPLESEHETDHGSRPLESERETDHGSRPLESEREPDSLDYMKQRNDFESRKLEKDRYNSRSGVIESQHCGFGETNTDLESRRPTFTLRESYSVSKCSDVVTLEEGSGANVCANTDVHSMDYNLIQHAVEPQKSHHLPQSPPGDEVMKNVPYSHDGDDYLDKIPIETVCVDTISQQLFGSSDTITHQRVSGSDQSASRVDIGPHDQNTLEDFNEIFEHPLLQDLQFGASDDKTSNNKTSFTFSDMDLKNKPSCVSNEGGAATATGARHVLMDLEQQPGFGDQYDILSGGYEKPGKGMGPKRDDLSLLGQRRSAASDTNASWDGKTAVPSGNKSESSDYTRLHEGDSKLVCGVQIDSAVDLESLPPRRLSISDIWSKGTGLVDGSGRSVEPVKLLTARPSVSTIKSCSAEAKTRPVKKSVTAELSAGQKTLMESVRESSKSPNTAFELFVKDYKDIVIADNPDADKFEVKFILKEKWSKLQSPEKYQYEDMEFTERERYWQDSLAQHKERHSRAVEEVSKDRIVTNSGDSISSKPGDRVAKPPLKKRKVEKIIIDDSKPEQRDGPTVAFSMDALKAKFATGFQLTQSQRQEDRPNPIGPLKSLGIWACCHGNKLMLFNHWRAQEILLYHKLMANHQIVCEPMNTTIRVKFDASLIEVLRSLKKKQYFPDTNYYIEDERLTNNGFRVKQIGDTNDYEIIQMTASLIAWYDESDLKEILKCIRQDPQATLEECRPVKVVNYFKAEAVRMSRQLSSNIGRSEIADILDQTWDNLPHDTDACLHGKPITHVLYDLDQLPGTQYTQSTQA